MSLLIPINASTLVSEFNAFVSAPDFPCVGAKAAQAKNQMRFLAAQDICSSSDDARILAGLQKFADDYRQNPAMFQSFVVIFSTDKMLTETEFELAMWDRVQSLTDKEEASGVGPDTRVSSNPDHADFSLSFGGEAFFIVGMHPGASRPARRFGHSVLVFNMRQQFVQLRNEGKYEKMRETILGRDEKLAGSRNPMIARHGDRSEARQYSGRAVGSDWQCPLRPRGGDAGNDL